jgi:hypothetical protein
MPRVAALYRYPVKGFTPEECETLTVLDAGRIAGDRVLGLCPLVLRGRRSASLPKFVKGIMAWFGAGTAAPAV